MLLQQAEYDTDYADADNDVYRFYNEKPSAVSTINHITASDLLDASRAYSYQDADTESFDQEAIERKKAQRAERYRDDPYYIAPAERSSSGTSTPMGRILRNSNGDQELDVDAIPVMELKLDDTREVASDPERTRRPKKIASTKKPKRHFEIAAEETIDGGDDGNLPASYSSSPSRSTFSRGKKSLLEVDSSGLSSLSLTDPASTGGRVTQLDIERRQAEELEMANALKEVERLRLEMQRAQERIQMRSDVPEEGTVVKRKVKKKKVKTALVAGEENANVGDGVEDATVAKKKKKKKKKEKSEADVEPEVREEEDAPDREPSPPAVKTKRKKKRQVIFDEDGNAAGAE